MPEKTDSDPTPPSPKKPAPAKKAPAPAKNEEPSTKNEEQADLPQPPIVTAKRARSRREDSALTAQTDAERKQAEARAHIESARRTLRRIVDSVDISLEQLTTDLGNLDNQAGALAADDAGFDLKRACGAAKLLTEALDLIAPQPKEAKS